MNRWPSSFPEQVKNGAQSILLASTNTIKLEESRHIFPTIDAVTLDIPEIQSTDPTLVVAEKLAWIAKKGFDRPVIVEDTGLFIDSWHGLPGALVKWFVEGMGASELSRLARLGGGEPNAEAVSAVGVFDRGETRIWSGRTRGKIVPPRGTLDGWTPIFEVTGSNQTLGELDFASRMIVTMRREPLEAARAWLLEQGSL